MKPAWILVAVVLLGIAGLLFYRGYCEYEAASSLEIRILDVSIKRVGATSADLSVVLEFRNPTSYDSPVFSAEYDVYIEGTYIGHGSLPPTAVPASGLVVRETTITIEYEKVAKGLIEALTRGGLLVTIRGKAHVKALFGLIPITLDFEVTRKL